VEKVDDACIAAGKEDATSVAGTSVLSGTA
jgi:hypothetical protein